MKVKIAVVQFKTELWQPEKNLKKTEQYIQLASEQKAQVIVFPEDFITGPIITKYDLIDKKNFYRDWFIEKAQKYSIDIITGSIIEGERKGLHNVSYYIDSDGKVKNRYCKINLWLSERSYLASGDEISVFNTKFGKSGIIICWDLAMPEIIRKMVLRGVKIIYCVSWWGQKDSKVAYKYDHEAEAKLVDSLCCSTAMNNGVALIYCNGAGILKIGRSYCNPLIGHSQIDLPFIGTRKILKHNKEEMFIEEINTNITSAHGRSYKIRDDLQRMII